MHVHRLAVAGVGVLPAIRARNTFALFFRLRSIAKMIGVDNMMLDVSWIGYTYTFTTALAYGPRTELWDIRWAQEIKFDTVTPTTHLCSIFLLLVLFFLHTSGVIKHTRKRFPTTYTYYHPRPLHERDWESDILISRSTSSLKEITSYILYLELLLRPDDADALLLLLLPLLSAMILLYALIVKC